MSTKEPCDHMIGYKIIEDEDYGEEIYIPVYASDDEFPDEEFNYCSYCGEKLQSVSETLYLICVSCGAVFDLYLPIDICNQCGGELYTDTYPLKKERVGIQEKD